MSPFWCPVGVPFRRCLCTCLPVVESFNATKPTISKDGDANEWTDQGSQITNNAEATKQAAGARRSRRTRAALLQCSRQRRARGACPRFVFPQGSRPPSLGRAPSLQRSRAMGESLPDGMPKLCGVHYDRTQGFRPDIRTLYEAMRQKERCHQRTDAAQQCRQEARYCSNTDKRW
jgi:hypothetical protein